jgi:hypothetical protein
MPKDMHGEPLETYRPLGRSYFYRADASGRILDVNDADIADMVARGCVVDEFALETSGGGTVKTIILTGNSSGTYPATSLTTSNTLILGFATQNNLTNTTYNFSPVSFLLVGNLTNPTNGWMTATNQIIDPTATDWTNYALTWLYE